MKLVNTRSLDTLADRTAAEIRALLARRGHSQADLARALATSPMWVSERLSGKVQITLNDLARIADALDVGPADLLSPRDREVTVTYVDGLAATPLPTQRRPFGGRPPGRTDKPGPPPGPRRTSPVR